MPLTRILRRRRSGDGSAFKSQSNSVHNASPNISRMILAIACVSGCVCVCRYVQGVQKLGLGSSNGTWYTCLRGCSLESKTIVRVARALKTFDYERTAKLTWLEKRSQTLSAVTRGSKVKLRRDSSFSRNDESSNVA